jgi:putative transposase
MARPLRIDIANGWYHVMARGIERRTVFRDQRDHEHFLELLEAMVDRFHLYLHAHAELDNHYHLLVQTPDANLSRAMQWVNMSYAAWFNARHHRVGPLFQGRFKSIPVEDASWAYAVSLYIHLNPCRRLSKAEKRAESRGLSVPDRAEAARRMAELRRYPWSSYRAYAGYVAIPAWLETREVLQRAASDAGRQVQAYREEVKQHLVRGVDPGVGERLADGFALGTEVFQQRVRRMAQGSREVARPRAMRQRITFVELVRIVESLSGEKAERFMACRGLWAKPMLLWAARRHTGMTLVEIGAAAGGMDYTAVAMSIRRFEERLVADAGLQTQAERLARRI